MENFNLWFDIRAFFFLEIVRASASLTFMFIAWKLKASKVFYHKFIEIFFILSDLDVEQQLEFSTNASNSTQPQKLSNFSLL